MNSSKAFWIAILLPFFLMILTISVFVAMKIINPKIVIGADVSPWVHTVFPALYSSVIYFYVLVGLLWGIKHIWPIEPGVIYAASYGIVLVSLTIAMLLPTARSPQLGGSFSVLDVYSLPGFFVPHAVLDTKLYDFSHRRKIP